MITGRRVVGGPKSWASGSSGADEGRRAKGYRGLAGRGAFLFGILWLTSVVPEVHSQGVLLRPGGDTPQAPPVPASAAERRAAEFVAAVEDGSPAAMAAFVRESMSIGSSSTKAEGDFDFTARVHAETGGIEPVSIRPTRQGVEMVMRSRLTGWRERLTLVLDPKPPHRIQEVHIQSPEPPGDLPEGSLSDGRLARETEALVSALARADAFSGAVLLARGDSVLFVDAYGEASKEFGAPNRLDTRFNLGSMNKMFTAVAVAQLVEAGKLSFEDPLSKFLPDHFARGVADEVRIKHLLSHTSGLGNFLTREFVASSRARARPIDPLEVTRGDSLAFEPGTRWQYSNTGFLVLGKVIELVSGQNYHDYVREHIYRPAGMDHTGELELDQVNRNVAVGYDKTYTEEGVRYRNNLFDVGGRGGPAGGGYSTVGDLHRFAVAMMGGKLVSPAMAEILMTPKPELSSPFYGFGFRQLATEGGRSVPGHGGDFPGVSSQLMMVPSTGHILVALSNQGGARFRVLALRKLLSR